LVIWQLYKDNKETKTVNQTANAGNAPKTPLQGTKLTNFTPVEKIQSLQKQEVKAGTGAEVKPGETVTVDYTGAVAATGVIFQSSLDRGQPVSFSLDGVIAGWKDGIPGAKVGGTYRLLIPAAQAYAASPPNGSGIPANADLVFDITIHSAGKANE
jgi:FKBP-type peptidyl-prolyl cis-trans isomerase